MGHLNVYKPSYGAAGVWVDCKVLGWVEFLSCNSVAYTLINILLDVVLQLQYLF